MAFFAWIGAVFGFTQTIGLAAAETTFLTTQGVAQLPAAFAAASLVSALASWAYASVVGRARNDRLLVWLVWIAAGVVVGLVWIASQDHPAAPWLILCVFFAVQSVFVSHLANLQVDYFDALESQRVFPVLAAATSAGGAIGGLAVMALSTSPGGNLSMGWALSLILLGLVVAVAGRRARFWYPILEEHEADDASTAGVLSAARYIRNTSMARWQLISVVSMVVAALLLQYAYLARFLEHFPKADELGAFLGAYLLISNVLEVIFSLWVAPKWIVRFGVPNANLGHPVLLLFSFGLMTGLPGLGAAIAARFSREALDNALAQPVRQLTYNALPPMVRGRVRALLDGFVLQAGMGIVGVLLLSLGGASMALSIGLGAAASMAYLFANARVRAHYGPTLIDQLLSGRTELLLDRSAIDRRRLLELTLRWEQLVENRAGRRVAGELAQRIAGEGWVACLVSGLDHSDDQLRVSCAEALAECTEPVAQGLLQPALKDANAEVRRIAVDALGNGLSSTQLRGLLADPDVKVRASAAAVLSDGESSSHLISMVARGGAEAAAALPRLPDDELELAVSCVSSPEDDVRAAALVRLARTSNLGAAVDCRPHLTDPNPAVRLAALSLLISTGNPVILVPLGESLGDPDPEIRQAAARGLEKQGTAGLERALSTVEWGSLSAASAGIQSIAGARGRERNRYLAKALRGLCENGLESLAALDALPKGGDSRFLRRAHRDRITRSVRLIFSILVADEGKTVVKRIENVLLGKDLRARASVLEGLGHLGRRRGALRLKDFLEATVLDGGLSPIGESSTPKQLGEFAIRATESADSWISLAGRASLAPESSPERNQMDQLIALRGVPLFHSLTLDQLDSVARVLDTQEWPVGEPVIRQGEFGDCLFIVLAGRVGIREDFGGANETRINEIRAGGHFGEMAVLRDERRNATAIIEDGSPAILAELSGEHLRSLILESPEIGLSIISDLIARFEGAEDRRRIARDQNPFPRSVEEGHE